VVLVDVLEQQDPAAVVVPIPFEFAPLLGLKEKIAQLLLADGPERRE
jgi:hypothetical protein